MLNHSSYILILLEPESVLEVQEKCLEATLKLEPGAFSCPVVWYTHFRLHHRLTTLSPGTAKSQGLFSKINFLIKVSYLICFEINIVSSAV